MPPGLVVFDCDGVLVESERALARVLAGCIRDVGLDVSDVEAGARYKGLALEEIEEDVSRRLGRPLPEGWTQRFRRTRFAAFERDGIPAVPGVRGAIERLARAGVPYCVASQGLLDKTEQTLGLSGLADLFPEDRRFSASQVPRPKPAPDLFLHAAATLGQPPERCVVVEDSVPGVTAGRAARMRVLAYDAEGETASLRAAGGEPFSAMERLPALLGLEAAVGRRAR